MVRSSSAKWHCASSMLDEDEPLDRREEERDESERGREGLGMDMGELMLNFFGGEDEGLMLKEEPRRERSLEPLSSVFSLGLMIQEIFSGILR